MEKQFTLENYNINRMQNESTVFIEEIKQRILIHGVLENCESFAILYEPTDIEGIHPYPTTKDVDIHFDLTDMFGTTVGAEIHRVNAVNDVLSIIDTIANRPRPVFRDKDGFIDLCSIDRRHYKRNFDRVIEHRVVMRYRKDGLIASAISALAIAISVLIDDRGVNIIYAYPYCQSEFETVKRQDLGKIGLGKIIDKICTEFDLDIDYRCMVVDTLTRLFYREYRPVPTPDNEPWYTADGVF